MRALAAALMLSIAGAQPLEPSALPPELAEAVKRHSPALEDGPGLFFRGRRVRAEEWKAHRPALDALTERFLEEVRPPFKLAPGAAVVTGEDDLAYNGRPGGIPIELTERERRLLGADFPVIRPHEAVDVGSRVSADGGRTLTTLASALVHPIHRRGRVEARHGGAYAAQRVELGDGPYRLVVDLVYGHVDPRSPLGPDRPVGFLSGDDRWHALDPVLAKRLPYKGNHLHLLVRGVNDLDVRHLVELSRPSGPNAETLEYVEYRRRFYNERLLPRLTGSR